MTTTATANCHGNDKMKTTKAFLETATPHPALSRKVKG
jgi:hypothetical protein